MSKVTSKLQVTLPKALATQYRIRPGDEILWVASGDVIRVVPQGSRAQKPQTAKQRLQLFDEATARIANRRAPTQPTRGQKERGWSREELYDRGRSR